jgi:cyclic pyranopterin phosphate synthase
LIDVHGRRISYVRMSVTDRCNLRCTYCMPADMRFLPRPELLTPDEIVLLAEAFVARGVTRIRLTGGEPLVRRDIAEIVPRIGALRGLDEVTLTTNGMLLDRHAAMLAAGGVARVNVSLDTLDPEAFRSITRGGAIERVLAGIAAARSAGLAVKINMVAQRAINQDQLLPMIGYCEAHAIDLSLIEAMPLGPEAAGASDSYIALADFIAPLTDAGVALAPALHRTGGPARYYVLPGKRIRLGLISPLSRNFCEGCNRVRVTATGRVYMCLGREDHVDLRGAVRSGNSEAVDEAIDAALRIKPLAHDFLSAQRDRVAAVSRTMSETGG